jgi:hypothetical protein
MRFHPRAGSREQDLAARTHSEAAVTANGMILLFFIALLVAAGFAWARRRLRMPVTATMLVAVMTIVVLGILALWGSGR